MSVKLPFWHCPIMHRVERQSLRARETLWLFIRRTPLILVRAGIFCPYVSACRVSCLCTDCVELGHEFPCLQSTGFGVVRACGEVAFRFVVTVVGGPGLRSSHIIHILWGSFFDLFIYLFIWAFLFFFFIIILICSVQNTVVRYYFMLFGYTFNFLSRYNNYSKSK